MSDTKKQSVTVLGATGTIGINTLDVISRHSERFSAFALTANKNVERMVELCVKHQPRYAVMRDAAAAEQLQSALANDCPDISVLQGEEALCQVSSMDEVDSVMAGIVGAAGLMPTLAAARTGKRVMLANKEALVMSGAVFMDEIKRSGAELLPIDSEHNAIFQCMPTDYERGLNQTGVRHILLTASGGPFRTMPLNELTLVTPEQAVAHPNWVMGQKISVDSATMMNKGLEVIEARWLFDATADQIRVVIHPQSVIHSMVAYNDGSVLAQLGNPDMRTPIAYALGWPERIESGVEDLDVFDVAQLNFEQPDYERFPCLRLAYAALEQGGTATAVLNAANEVAVAAFLERRIAYTDIAATVEDALSRASMKPADDLEVIIASDQQARQLADEFIHRQQAL